jgi:hypothetical protein
VLHAEKKNFVTPCGDFYRPPGFPGQQSRHRLQLAIELSAETAAESKNDYPHIDHGQFEDSRELALDYIGILAGRPDGYLSVAHLRDGDMGFEGGVIHRR